jgi:hypothetical protein
MTTEEEVVWQPVSNGGDFNDFPLAFVNVEKETDEVSFNIDGEDVTPEDTPGPMIQGTFQGITDISSDSNPEPSIKVLVESEKDERTYALNKVNALESQLEDEVEEGEVIGLDFEGYERPEDGLPWQNWQVYRPAQ